MDQDLKRIFDGAPRDDQDTVQFTIEAGGEELTIPQPDGPPVSYRLKPLAELYGQGLNRASLDPKDEAYQPLLMAIESEIVTFDESVHRLSDGAVSLALQALAASPEADLRASNPLAHALQLVLRLTLSLRDYSRQDVRQALRTVSKSVHRHTRADGPRGYLDFIRDYV